MFYFVLTALGSQFEISQKQISCLKHLAHPL